MERYLSKGAEFKLKGIDGRYVIKDIIGRGSSCVVYTADFYNANGEKTEHLLKEFNPRCIELKRNADGLIPTKDEEKELFNSLCNRFKEGFERQSELRAVPEIKNYTANIQNTYYDNGTIYIDMTETNGNSYAEVAEKSIYSLAQRIRVLAQVIGHYHEHGYLHLDIKPGNIFVRPEDETCQDVLLFDFDSLVPFREENGKCIFNEKVSVSYTAEYAPIELLTASRRDRICKATDIYEIGEIFFEKLMGRHSTALEHNIWADFEYDLSAPIFKNVNPKVIPLLDELFTHTLCNNVNVRYQSTEELIKCLDEIIELSNPKEPFLKSSLPNVSGFFTGRDSEIEEIHKRLQENNVLFLSGIGGIGKSELAKHYAKAHKDSYDAIIFAPFLHDIQTMITNDSYVQIHNFFQYPEEKPNEYFERKMRELARLCNERTLIIVDNFNTTEDENLDKLLSLNCKMLITTRRDFSGFNNQQLYVDKLRSNSEIRKIFDTYYKVSDEEESACVDEIIELVEGHTMTVELIAKQIEAEWATADEILDKLKETGISGIGESDVDSGKDSRFSSKNAYGHIKALFDTSLFFRASQKQELNILKQLSLLPHTGIEHKLFLSLIENDSGNSIFSRLVPYSSLVSGGTATYATNSLSKSKDDMCFDNCQEPEIKPITKTISTPKVAINTLIKLGWMRFNTDTKYISVHPLIAEIVLDSVGDSSIFESFAKAYTSHLRKRGSSDDVGSNIHREDSKINVHLLTIIQRYNFSDRFFGELLNEIGGKFFTLHQLELALQACEKSVDIALKNHDSGSYSVTESMVQTALIKAAIGSEKSDVSSIKEAIDTYLNAMENYRVFDENEYPDKYEEIATLYSYIGMAYEDIGDISKAKEMFSNGIDVYLGRDKMEEKDYMSLGVLYNNIGNIHEPHEALTYYLAAEDNHDKVGVVTRHAAITFYHLADIYSNSESGHFDLELAAEYARKALDFFINEYSEDLFMIGESKYMLGKVYSQFNEPDLAREAYMLLNEAKEIFVNFLPIEDRTILKTSELIERTNKFIKS